MSQLPAPTVFAVMAIFLNTSCNDVENGDRAQRQVVAPVDEATHDADAAYKKCISDISTRDVIADVRSQLKAGQYRFYWTYDSEGDLLHPPGMKNCQPRSPTVVRSEKINDQDIYDDASTGLRRRCLDEIAEYKIKYNWSLARSNPESIKMSCLSNEAQIDSSLRLTNKLRYR